MYSIFDVRISRHRFRSVTRWCKLSLLLGLAMNGCAAASPPLDPTAQLAGGQLGNGQHYWPVALEATRDMSRYTSRSLRR